MGKVLTFYLVPLRLVPWFPYAVAFVSHNISMADSAIAILEIEKQRSGMVEWETMVTCLLGRMG